MSESSFFETRLPESGQENPPSTGTVERFDRAPSPSSAKEIPAEYSERVRQALRRGPIGEERVDLPPTSEKIEKPANVDVSDTEGVAPAIEKILKREVEGSFELQNPELLRLDRDLALAQSVERLASNEVLDTEDTHRLVGTLESRGWYRLIESVHEGDYLVSFLVPSDASFSIKSFNDRLFGMQGTDTIIGHRRMRLKQLLEEEGFSSVASSFKDDYFQLSKEEIEKRGTENVQQSLNRIAHRMRFEMTRMLVEESMQRIVHSSQEEQKEALHAFILEILGKEHTKEINDAIIRLAGIDHLQNETVERTIKNRLALQEARSLEDKDAFLRANQEVELTNKEMRAIQDERIAVFADLHESLTEPALRNHPQAGYRMTFGTALIENPKEEKDFTHIERGISLATKGAMISRERETPGSSFAAEDAERVFHDLARIRDRIGMQEIRDRSGNTLPIFSQRPDGYVMLNIDLIRDIRKGHFSPDPEQQPLFDLVNTYLQKVNILDVMKPYTHEELSGEAVHGSKETIRDRCEQTKKQVFAFRQGKLDPSMRQQIVQELRRDAKDGSCTSQMEFNRQAVAIQDCAYISLDVLDVGPRLIQEFDVLIQRVQDGELSFAEAQVIAGDETTKVMRAFRSEVIRLYHEHVGEDEPLLSVGGDEVMLAMDSSRTTDAFILALQRIRLSEDIGGQVRVVQTAIGQAERHSSHEQSERIKREHLEAKKRAEQGTDIAKKMEKFLRGIKRAIVDLPEEERGTHYSSLDALGLEEFALIESSEGNAFELLCRRKGEDVPYRMDVEDTLFRVQELSASLQKDLSERRSALFAELQPSYSKLRAEYMHVVLRRLNRAHGNKNDSHFQSFMKSFI